MGLAFVAVGLKITGVGLIAGLALGCAHVYWMEREARSPLHTADTVLYLYMCLAFIAVTFLVLTVQ